jgi:hypothetical protein
VIIGDMLIGGTPPALRAGLSTLLFVYSFGILLPGLHPPEPGRPLPRHSHGPGRAASGAVEVRLALTGHCRDRSACSDSVQRVSPCEGVIHCG